jgi:hypothetical protein
MEVFLNDNAFWIVPFCMIVFMALLNWVLSFDKNQKQE